jgi:hypothetical protein
MITLITPTGDRHISFKICEQWMSRQTIPYHQWIVVDDGKVPTVPVQNQTYIRREPSSTGHRSLADNMLVALKAVKGDKIIIIEDDDYYSPNYLKTMSDWLNRSNIAGETKAIYYNIRDRYYYQNQNTKHASFCNTGFTEKNILPLTRICESHDSFLDIKFWHTAYGSKSLYNTQQKMCIGMKCMPGRMGIGGGHLRQITNDPLMIRLKTLIGDDYRVYENLSQDSLKSLPPELARFRRNINGNIILIRPNRAQEALLNRLLVKVGDLEWAVANNTASEITKMKDIYKGIECNIIGKGPSLDRMTELPNLPTICINESIRKVEDLINPPGAIYCIQQDAHLKNTCWSSRGTMLLPYITQSWYNNHPKVITYTPSSLGLKDNYHGLSIIMAIRIAKLWGIEKINFYACDAAMNSNTEYAKCVGYDPTRGGDPNRFIRHVKSIEEQLGGMTFEYKSI